MKRRFVMAAGMSALLLATVVPASTSARSPERFGRVDTGGRTVDLSRLPSRQDPNRMVDVYVEFAGEPVAALQGEALDAGRELSEAEKASARRLLAQRQANLKTRLRGLGARIEASYTDVLNAVRVRMPAGRVADAARLAGVVRISEVPMHFRNNANSVDYLAADTTWGATGYTGDGVNIAIIDSGINYYHRDFAGPSGWAADNGRDRSDGNFPTAKVIAGYDFTGDDYNPSDDDPTNDTPDPDNDPLDCKAADSPNVQHGTHVAGTAAGMGVLSNGATFTGPYDANTLSANSFRIAPGTAPEANLMAYRVFGCDGGTLLVVDAIERAVRDGADVINMSLGSGFGNQSADTIAVDNAALAGVVVVMSAGNNGPSAYITGSPGVATRGISVAAMDAVPSFPSVRIDMPTGSDIEGINANGDTDDLPLSGDLNVFEDNPATPTDPDTGEGGEHLGCHEADYVYNGFVAGQIAVTFRGVCARVDRAIVGDDMGADAVIMINNAEALPPFEGPINGVDIPFIGVRQGETARFETDDGGNATISAGPDLDNEFYKHTADFTSGGPRRGDSMLKPDVAAPGVGVFSADGSTVNKGKSLSGTSMASPAVAGVAALVREAHPTWSVAAIKGAIVGTANPGKLKPYQMRLSGNGLAAPRRAVDTRAYATTVPGASTMIFGAEEVGHWPPQSPYGYVEHSIFKIHNTSDSSITYDLRHKFDSQAVPGVQVSLNKRVVTVPANSTRQVRVTLRMTVAAAEALPDTAPFHGPLLNVDDYGQLYNDLVFSAGAVIANPRQSGAGLYNLRIPWLVAPRGISNITPHGRAPNTSTPSGFETSVQLTNEGVHAGIADVYAWGLIDHQEDIGSIDLRAAGVQSLPAEVCTGVEDPADRCLIVAVNMWQPWNAAAENEVDILIDTTNDGIPDYVVIAVDLGLILGALEGVLGSVVVDLDSGAIVDLFFATAGNNGATMLVPFLASDLGLGGAGRFDYYVESYELYDDVGDGLVVDFDIMTNGQGGADGSLLARFYAFDHPISNGDFIPMDPGDTVTLPLYAEEDGKLARNRGMKGWLVVTLEDPTGRDAQDASQADTVPLGRDPNP